MVSLAGLMHFVRRSDSGPWDFRPFHSVVDVGEDARQMLRDALTALKSY
jgi:hypothetical protein